MPRFSLFEIYLTYLILPPFPIPNTYTEESKTTKWCWCRGTDPILPLNFYPSIIFSFSFLWSLFPPFFIFLPSEDVIFPSEDNVWIIVFQVMTKWLQDWRLNQWFKYFNPQTIHQMRRPCPPYSILLVFVSIVQANPLNLIRNGTESRPYLFTKST